MENTPNYIKFAEYIESIRDSDDEALEELIGISHYFEQGAKFLYVFENLDRSDRTKFALDLVRDESLKEWFSDYDVIDEKSLKNAWAEIEKRLEKIFNQQYVIKELSNTNKIKHTGKNDDLEFLKFCVGQIAKSQNMEIDFNTKQILIKSPSC